MVYGTNRDERLAVRPAHREYLGRLTADGKLVLAGSWVDDTGAVLVFDVKDRAELNRILDADPYTTAKLIAEQRIREWTPIAGSRLST